VNLVTFTQAGVPVAALGVLVTDTTRRNTFQPIAV